ncbi:MAG: hypothetical protein K2L35_00065, partial [Muribaculaceae bacterium]|nr:hypothetical protein [Muribaculaceae bacterium]
GTSRPEIADALEKLLSPSMQQLAARRINPYHHPDTPGVMTRTILSSHFHPYPSKHFHTYPPGAPEATT